MLGISGVIFGQHVGRDPLEHLLGEDPQQLPANIEGLENGTIFVAPLRDEILLELGQELQVEQIVSAQRLLSDHGLHGLHVLANSITSIQLV